MASRTIAAMATFALQPLLAYSLMVQEHSKNNTKDLCSACEKDEEISWDVKCTYAKTCGVCPICTADKKPEYVVGVAGANGCSFGQITDPAICNATTKNSGRVDQIFYGGAPKGCYKSDGWPDRVFFNAHPNGTGQSWATPICQAPPQNQTDDQRSRKKSTDKEHKDFRLQYLRIPKTGSESFIQMMKEASEENAACKDVLVQGSHTATGQHAKGTTMVVLRDPCDRFVSSWAHIRSHVNHSAEKRGCPLLHDVIQTPITFAQELLRDPTLRDNVLSDTFFKSRDCRSSVVAWPQSMYGNKHTEYACLPTMVRDVQNIFDKYVPGCKLLEKKDSSTLNTRRKTNLWKGNPIVCELAKTIYADDAKLWYEHCAQ